MQEAAVVGQLSVEIVTNTATGAQLVLWDVLDVGDVIRIENLVDATAMLVQGSAFRWSEERVTARSVGLSRRQPGLGTG